MKHLVTCGLILESIRWRVFLPLTYPTGVWYDSYEVINMSTRKTNTNHAVTTRLNRIEGQVRGIKVMIERDEYCDDVLTQIASVKSAIDGVAKILLESHVQTCIAPRLAQGDEAAIQELLKSMGRLVR